MTPRKRAATPRRRTTMTAAAVAVQDVLDDSHGQPRAVTAAKVADAVVAAAPATQVRRPWRSTVRTLVQLVLGLAPMLPLLVDASGVDDTLPAVAGALAISGGITRVMALPQVEVFLQRFVPWLAASPRPAGA